MNHLPRIGLVADETLQLRRHIRDAHPNLLGDPTSRIAYGPLPQSGLSEVPSEWLYAIHQANHAGLYRPHLDDEWLVRESPQQVRHRDGNPRNNDPGNLEAR
jgi:hypothetical protein